MVGQSLESQGIHEEPVPGYVSVKESVFPFAKFPGVDIVLGPEMRSTGEVMGIDTDFAAAFAKSQNAAHEQAADRAARCSSASPRGTRWRSSGRRAAGRDGLQPDEHQRHRRGALGRGHRGLAGPEDPRGTPEPARPPGQRRDRPDREHPRGKGARTDEGRIRASAVSHGVPCITTVAGAKAAVTALERLRQGKLEVYALQDLLKLNT